MLGHRGVAICQGLGRQLGERAQRFGILPASREAVYAANLVVQVPESAKHMEHWVVAVQAEAVLARKLSHYIRSYLARSAVIQFLAPQKHFHEFCHR